MATKELAGKDKRSGGRRLSQKLARIFSWAAVLLVAAVLLLGLLRATVFVSLYGWLFSRVLDLTGADLWLARALTLGLVAGAFFLPWYVIFLPWIRRWKPQARVLLALPVVMALCLHFVTRDVYFARSDGKPLRYYIRTLDGFKVSAGSGIDPVYGIEYKPVTAEVAREYLLWQRHGGDLKSPTVPIDQFFNSATGEPVRWYARLPDGRYDFFTLPGFHPKYGMKLEPVTPEIVQEYETWLAAGAREAAARWKDPWQEERAQDRRSARLSLGSVVRTRLLNRTEGTRDGERFTVKLTEPLSDLAGVTIPHGSIAWGRVALRQFALGKHRYEMTFLVGTMESADGGRYLFLGEGDVRGKKAGDVMDLMLRYPPIALESR